MQGPHLRRDVMKINFENFVSRGVAVKISKELDLSGIKMSVNKILGIMIVPGIVIFTLISVLLFEKVKLFPLFAVLAGVGVWAFYIVIIFMYVEFAIDKRKSEVENFLPDYFQLVAANLRSGISLDKSLLLSAKPEFKFFSEDVKEISRLLFTGETMEGALTQFANKYNSNQLKRSIRMMIEAIRYGGAMADLLSQLAKDLRKQLIIQKEVGSQLLMYIIFIVFASLIATPMIFSLTNRMILVTDTVWKGILQQNPNGLPNVGISLLKPSPPQISPNVYYDFSIISIIIIAGFASFIMSTISSGSMIKGLRLLPLFVLVALGVFLFGNLIIPILFPTIGNVI